MSYDPYGVVAGLIDDEEGFEAQLEIEKLAKKPQFVRIRPDLCQQVSESMPADRGVSPIYPLLVSSAIAANLLGIGKSSRHR